MILEGTGFHIMMEVILFYDRRNDIHKETPTHMSKISCVAVGKHEYRAVCECAWGAE